MASGPGGPCAGSRVALEKKPQSTVGLSFGGMLLLPEPKAGRIRFVDDPNLCQPHSVRFESNSPDFAPELMFSVTSSLGRTATARVPFETH